MSGTKMVWSVKLDPDTADELESIAESLGWTKQIGRASCRERV